MSVSEAFLLLVCKSDISRNDVWHPNLVYELKLLVMRIYLDVLSVDESNVYWLIICCDSPRLLTWEDGLCGASRPMNPVEGVLDSFYLCGSNERPYPICPASIHSGNLSNGALGVTIAEMSNFNYAIGHGLVGEVAYTENPSWISVDNFIAGEISPDVISECPDEILHQFIAGVKTILLVPLAPHGVLQLGSLDVVKEDDDVVVNIRDEFNSYNQFASSFTEFGTFCLENLHPSTIMKVDEDLAPSREISVEGQKTSNVRQVISLVQDLNQISGDMMAITDKGSEIGSSIHELSDFAELFNPQMWEFSESEKLLDSYEFSCSDMELECLSNFSGYSVKNWKYPDSVLQSYSDEWIHILEGHAQASCLSERQVLNFPIDCELHESLGHGLLNPPILDLLDQNANVNSVGGGSTTSNNVPSGGDSGGLCLDRTKAEFLLEAVVSEINNRSGYTSTNKFKAAALKSSSSELLVSDKFGEDDLSDGSQIPHSCVTTTFSGEESAMDISHLVQPQRNGNEVLPPTRISKVADGRKKRARSVNCQKPRPRDRQLIQDRIKELRDLVPNGGKCSIDGLLDRTIKHMQFLASVTNRADKLRRHVERKVSIPKDVKIPKMERNNHNGSSWALEVESDLQTCPIYVKDLEYPGHLLIEMLCNDDGRFLEIADVIQRLDLTILNGSMEKRSDEIAWARFIVEVPVLLENPKI
ncbi:OLC1v1034891C2 [Oldenlandia corymbosa var. corymbosa]|uniref:OLC1v1034891C2 n=1 Tax=Oldenlandia corymbosa var. corymbosa TaxID=529605 RepID=A0AAV1CSA6_OLDCO|nr:OLC1v1034891C2 [Oldenlandia corymbosa var. corymbosa]